MTERAEHVPDAHEPATRLRPATLGLDLVGLREIALRLGVDARRAYAITKRQDFPEPCAQITQGRIWQREDVEAWMRRAASQ